MGQTVWLVTTEAGRHGIEDGAKQELHSRSRVERRSLTQCQADVQDVDYLDFLICHFRADPVQCFGF